MSPVPSSGGSAAQLSLLFAGVGRRLPLLMLMICTQSAAEAQVGRQAAQEEDEDSCRVAERHYEAGHFQLAVSILEQAVTAGLERPCQHHMLGKSYGRMASAAPWYRALGLARQTLKSFNRAVELDNGYLPALRDLIDFHRQAPRIVGGDPRKAAQFSRRVAALQAATTTHPSALSKPSVPKVSETRWRH